MHHLSVDYWIVYSILFGTLLTGLWAGKHVTSIREYVLGNQAFGTAALVLTFLVTELGKQGLAGLVGNMGTIGIIVPITFLSLPLSYVIQSRWLAPKMMYFSQCMTIGEIMGILYGRSVQVMVGLFSFITSIFFASVGITVLGTVTHYFLGIDTQIGIIVGGLMLTWYVVKGGIKAVATTDVLQSLAFLVPLPVLAVIALQHAGGVKFVLTHVPHEQLLLWNHPQFFYYLVSFLLLGTFHNNLIDPALVQRLLMAKSKQQLRNMLLTLAGLWTVLLAIFTLLHMTGHQLYPSLAAPEIVPHMISTLLPVGLRGILAAGVISVVVAGIDSYLHAAALNFVHDVLQPLYGTKSVYISELRWVRRVTLWVGLLAIGLGLAQDYGLYQLTRTALSVAMSLLVVPFFTGILGLKPDRYAFYTSTAVTQVLFFVGKLYFPATHTYFLPLICVLASGLTFFTVHFIRHHGFVVVRRNITTHNTYVWQPRGGHFAQLLRYLFSTPRRIIYYSQRQVATYGAPYLLFGTFCSINFMLPYFMWAHASPSSHNLMLYLRVLGGFACGLLIVRDKWPASLLPYLPTFWHVTLLYCLPFTSTVMFLLTKGSIEWLINITLTIMFLVVLVDWLSFVILSVLGITLGIGFYRLAFDLADLKLDFNTAYALVYACVFSTLIALLFARRRKQHLEAKFREISAYSDTINPVTENENPANLRIANLIEQKVQEVISLYNQPSIAHTTVLDPDTAPIDLDFLNYFFPTAVEVIKQGPHLNQPLVQAIREHYMVPHLSQLSLQICLETALEAYSTQHQHSITIDRSVDYKICTSFYHLQYALIHILQFLHAHHHGTEHIRLWVEENKGVYMRLSGQVLAPDVVDTLCSLFPLQTTAKHPGLAISKLLLEAHGGWLLCNTSALSKNTYTEFVFMIPPAEESILANLATG